MRELARLLLPGVRWDPVRGFAGARPAVLRAVGAGVGGVVVEGGSCDEVAALAAEIRATADEAPIIAVAPSTLTHAEWSDRPLAVPAPAALVALRDPHLVRRAARAAARAARRGGCNALLSPSCDLPPVPQPDPFGTDSAAVASTVAEWIDAAQAEGVLCFAGHFPGLGRARRDASGASIVTDGDDALYAADLVPFRAAIDAGVAGLRVANTAYPALDPSRIPAIRSSVVVSRMLREQLGFDGLTVADAVLPDPSGDVATDLIAAGIDLVMRPASVDLAVRAMAARAARGEVDPSRVHDALIRRRMRAELAGAPEPRSEHDGDPDREWLDDAAERAIAVVRGRRVSVTSPVEVAVPSGDAHRRGAVVRALADGIAQAGGDPAGVRQVATPSAVVRTTLIVVLVPSEADGPGAGLDDPRATEQTAAVCAESRRVGRDVAVVWGGHPATSPLLPSATLLVACWTADSAMLRAAGRWLIRRV